MRHVSKAALAFWLWSILPLAAAGDAMEDPILQFAPKAVQKAFEQTFPAHRVLRVVERQAGGTPVYRITAFSPTDMTVHTKKTGNDTVSELLLHHLELTADGKVLEESQHAISESRVPKAVLDAYRKWNPNDAKGFGPFWGVEQEPGKERVFLVSFLPNSLVRYWASFNGNGSIIAAEPARVP